MSLSLLEKLQAALRSCSLSLPYIPDPLLPLVCIYWCIGSCCWGFWLSYPSDQLTEASQLAQEKQQEMEWAGADVGPALPQQWPVLLAELILSHCTTAKARTKSTVLLPQTCDYHDYHITAGITVVPRTKLGNDLIHQNVFYNAPIGRKGKEVIAIRQLIHSEQFNKAADHLPVTASAVIKLLTEWVHPGQLSLWLTNLISSSYPSLQSYRSFPVITNFFQTPG